MIGGIAMMMLCAGCVPAEHAEVRADSFACMVGERVDPLDQTPVLLGVQRRGVLAAAPPLEAGAWQVPSTWWELGSDPVKLRYRLGIDGAAVVQMGFGHRAMPPTIPRWLVHARAPRVVSIGQRLAVHDCPWEDGLAIQIDQPAAGFRVRWWADDRWSEAVVGAAATFLDPAKGVLVLGKLACAPSTVPLAEFHTGVLVDVRAIRLDGTEVAIDGLPALLDLDELEPFTDLDAFVEDPDVAAAGAGAGDRTGTGATAMALLGMAACVGIARGRRLSRAMRGDDAPLPVAILRR